MAGAAHGEPDDFIAYGEITDVGAEFGHHSRQVAALTGGKRGRELVGQGTTPDDRLTRVDSGRLDLDQNLAGLRNRAGYLAHLEDVDAAVRVELHCFGHERHIGGFA